MPEDMETLADEVQFQAADRAHEPGTSIPAFLVDEQEKLARMGPASLSMHFANVLYAMALRRPGWTPERVLREAAGFRVVSDDAWHERVRGELVRALRARGVELELETEREVQDDVGSGAGDGGGDRGPEEQARGEAGKAAEGGAVEDDG